MGSMEYKEGELSNRLNLISFEEAGNVEKVKSFKLTINHDGEVFTESFPASDWQNIVIEGSTTSIKILKAEVEVGIPMKYVGFVATMFNTEDGWQHTKVKLIPLNKDYDAIELDDEIEYRTIGILKCVLSNE